MKKINSNSAIENCEAVLAQVSEIVKSTVEYQKNEYKKGNDEAYKYSDKMIVDDDTMIGVYVDMRDKTIEVLVYKENKLEKTINVKKTSENRCPRIEEVINTVMVEIIEMGSKMMDNENNTENKTENAMAENIEMIERENSEVFTPMAVARYVENGGVSVSTDSEYRVGFYGDLLCVENKCGDIVNSKCMDCLDGIEGIYKWINAQGRKYGFANEVEPMAENSEVVVENNEVAVAETETSSKTETENQETENGEVLDTPSLADGADEIVSAIMTGNYDENVVVGEMLNDNGEVVGVSVSENREIGGIDLHAVLDGKVIKTAHVRYFNEKCIALALAELCGQNEPKNEGIACELFMSAISGNKAVANEGEVAFAVEGDKLVASDTQGFEISTEMSELSVAEIDRAIVVLKKKFEDIADDFNELCEISIDADMTDDEIDLIMKEITGKLKAKYNDTENKNKEDKTMSEKEILEDIKQDLNELAINVARNYVEEMTEKEVRETEKYIITRYPFWDYLAEVYDLAEEYDIDEEKIQSVYCLDDFNDTANAEYDRALAERVKALNKKREDNEDEERIEEKTGVKKDVLENLANALAEAETWYDADELAREMTITMRGDYFTMTRHSVSFGFSDDGLSLEDTSSCFEDVFSEKIEIENSGDEKEIYAGMLDLILDYIYWAENNITDRECLNKIAKDIMEAKEYVSRIDYSYDELKNMDYDIDCIDADGLKYLIKKCGLEKLEMIPNINALDTTMTTLSWAA